VRHRHVALDLDAGLLVGVGAAVYATIVGAIRGVVPDRIPGVTLLLLAVGFGALGFAVGSVVAARPDFGTTTRGALLRGFVATVPVYAAGGLMFIAPEQWLTLLPLFSVVPAALVGPPIGVFMYRLYRRAERRDPRPSIFSGLGEAASSPDTASPDPSVDLAWQKGELLGSWTPLLVTVALFASFGLGSLAIELADLELRGLRPRETPSLHVNDRLPVLVQAVRTDSTDAAARLKLGSVLVSFGRFDEAVEQLSEAVRLDSTLVESWRMLGRAAFYAGRRDLALEAYWNAQRIDPAVVQRAGIDRVVWLSLLNPIE
jgi:hypothetical protein